jgi:Flp pilus assembly protein TadD
MAEPVSTWSHKPVQGKLEEAVAECRAVIRIKPDYAAAHYNRGHALHNQGKLEEAVAEYRTAVRFKPDDARLTQATTGGAGHP